ncbi:MAG TPA: amino acid permease [Gemmatimonadales bacterium]|nr:amino acid permease [Gemmatimonadales bacterium]
MSASPSSAASPPPDRWGDRLPRRLGLWSAVAVLIGSTIGSGIFRTPAIIAERVPDPLPMFGVWILGGLLALCGALTYAELAALFPRSGGVYVYIREAFGRLPAFLFGWTELLLIRASALGAIATPFAEYLLRSLGLDPKVEPNATYVHYVAAGAIVATAALNYVGVRWSSLILNLTTGAKYGALVLLVLLAFLVGQGDFGHFAHAGATGAVSPGLFGLALVSVLWAYDGWGDLSFVGGEVKDPERNLPRALILGTTAIIGIYLLVNTAYLYLIPIGQMARSPLVAADAAQLIIGRAGVGLVAVVVMVATFSTLLGSILTSPRIFFAMADDGLLFKRVAQVHPRFQTPSVAIVVTGLLGVVWVLLLNFEQLADQFVVAIFPFYALAAAAVFVLRRRQPDRPRPVRVWGYPVVPLLFVVATFLILGNALREHPVGTGLAFGGILLGVPVYMRAFRPRSNAGQHVTRV